jgi:hypothetical protein
MAKKRRNEIFPLLHMNRGCTIVLVIYHQRYVMQFNAMFSLSKKERDRLKSTLTQCVNMNLVLTSKQLPQLENLSDSRIAIINRA